MKNATQNPTKYWPVDAGFPIARWWLQARDGSLYRPGQPDQKRGGYWPAKSFRTPDAAIRFALRNDILDAPWAK